MAQDGPSLEKLWVINKDGSRNFVHPADVRGRFTSMRVLVGWVLIAIYVVLPWVEINGSPAVFIDVANRQFHFLGLTFAPQDFWLAFFLITGLGFSLFFVTALFGRIWCGWGCPQTVFLEYIYRRIERWIEGPAIARKQLDASPWNRKKILRRGSKLLVFALVSLVIAHVFISYFVSLPRLYEMARHAPTENWAVFLFMCFLTGTLFFNFTWFREQFCIVLCPYGRLQSALIDQHSYIIGYDKQRGEPRGKANTPGAGDCVDCRRCVQVCPTGIDIRNGLQIECIGCANCIDACDEIMTKLRRPTGLVRYDSSQGLAGLPKRFIRPRIVLYSVLLLLGAAVMTYSFSTFKPATATLVRMVGAPYFVDNGILRNQYLIRIINKQNKPVTFDISLAQGPEELVFDKESVEVPALGEQLVPAVLTIPVKKFQKGASAQLEVRSSDGKISIRKNAPILGPTLQ